MKINWWIQETENLRNWISPPPISAEIFCDASDIGWGGVHKNEKTGGSWNTEEVMLHINAKEMLAILFILKSFSIYLRDKQCKNIF